MRLRGKGCGRDLLLFLFGLWLGVGVGILGGLVGMVCLVGLADLELSLGLEGRCAILVERGVLVRCQSKM